LKTCARIQKIILRAKRSFERLKKQPSPDYTPIFDEDEDREEEDYVPEEKPSRKKRLVRKQFRKKPVLGRKCRPKIEIPICSDTSINICITTEEEDECGSSTDNQQIGYISKELDSAFYREDSEDESSQAEVVQNRKKAQKRNKKPQVNEKPYVFAERQDTSTENEDVDDRYQDAARGPSLQKQRSYDKKKPTDFYNRMLQTFKPEEIAAQAEQKLHDKLHDKLVTEWKYKPKEGEDPQQRNAKDNTSLGAPPPPRTHKGGARNK